jgi:hypothetical protein
MKIDNQLTIGLQYSIKWFKQELRVDTFVYP